MPEQSAAPRPMPFVKMHGLGNDFVVLDTRPADPGRGLQPRAVTTALARALGDRRRGVGFDQLVVIGAYPGDGADATVAFYNPDGGRAGACGNGARCAADLLMREAGTDAILMASDAGLLPSRRLPDGRVEVDMGPPKLDWRDIPLAEASDTLRIDVKLGPLDAPALWGPTAVSMGNPHAVFFVDDADGSPVETLGPMIENHPMFPERTNVEFVSVETPERIRMRVWERGAGVTQACGSGACAALVAAVRRGFTERRAVVALDGGELEIAWRATDDHVLMTGPTATVFAGAVHPSFLAEVAAADAEAEAAAADGRTRRAS